MNLGLSPFIFNFIQKPLLTLSYYFFYFFPKRNISWVVGVNEVAANLKHLSSCIPKSYSVMLYGHKFYDFKYSFKLVFQSNFISKFLRIIVGPILLGRLLHEAHGFIYIHSPGFLLDNIDSRDYEFSFIKKKNKALVCYFLGNDIRSPKKMLEYANEKGITLTANFYSEFAPERLSESYELLKMKIAQAADSYADLIFNEENDQRSYLKSKTEKPFYFFPDEDFHFNLMKFNKPETIKVLHAPSNPKIKGTEYVRSSIGRLKAEGYQFDYLECLDLTNYEVLTRLKESHIVLNEFFSLAPGVFGIEALANSCALLTSSDQFLEKTKGEINKDAWMITKHNEIYDHLKLLLDDLEMAKEYARNGYESALKNASISESGIRLSNFLSKLT